MPLKGPAALVDLAVRETVPNAMDQIHCTEAALLLRSMEPLNTRARLQGAATALQSIMPIVLRLENELTIILQTEKDEKVLDEAREFEKGIDVAHWAIIAALSSTNDLLTTTSKVGLN